MKSDEIVKKNEIAEFSPLMPGARLAFMLALLEECRLLQQRIEYENLVASVMQVEFTWVDSGGAEHLSPAQDVRDADVLRKELTSSMKDLLEIDHIMHDLAAMIGADNVSYGSLL